MKPILVCEPQCRGFEHARFNAAMLWTVLLAYPGAPIVFWGEAEHLAGVREMLSGLAPAEIARISWREKEVPPRHLGGWPRLFREIPWFRPLLQSAPEAGWVLVLSVTNTAILALKLLLARRGSTVPILAIPHGTLSFLLGPQSRKPWTWPLLLRQIFRLPQPASLKYVALGPSIHHQLAQVFPRLASQFVTLDLPYFWSEQDISPEELPPERVRFGYFGVSTKGFDRFARLAEAVKPAFPQADFTLVGFLNKADHFSPVVSGLGTDPLSEEEFRQRARTLTYPVWLADAAYYRLAASASFLDALSYVKPGIYLDNPYVAHYARSMGDIGYLCRDEDEMTAVVEDILRQFPVERYRRQCRNILNGRALFEPATLAPQLRGLVEGHGESLERRR